MKNELAALEKNETWTLYDLPSDKRAIRCSWKYKLKLNPDGTHDKPKSRLVAQGFTQIVGVDFHACFSPVAKQTTVRTLIHFPYVQNWHLQYIYVNNAFLHGYLHEEIYMRPPEGYEKAKPGQVCKLNKSLYGLK